MNQKETIWAFQYYLKDKSNLFMGSNIDDRDFGQIYRNAILNEKSTQNESFVDVYIADDDKSTIEGTKELLGEIEFFIRTTSYCGVADFVGYFLLPTKGLILKPIVNESLHDLFSNREKQLEISNNTFKAKLIFGVACTMMHIHSFKIPYLHLNPCNIYFSDNWNPIIGEYLFEKKENRYQAFQDPQLKSFQDSHLLFADVYSFGILLKYIVNNGDIESDQLDASGLISKMVSYCTNHDLSQRPLFSQIVKALLNEEQLFPNIDVQSYKEFQNFYFNGVNITKENYQLFHTNTVKNDQIEFNDISDCSPESLEKMGCQYIKEEENEENKKRAFYCFKKASEQGSKTAKLKLVSLYEKGYGCPMNKALAEEMIKQLASPENQFPKAAVKYSKWLISRGDFANAKMYLTSAQNMENNSELKGEIFYLKATIYENVYKNEKSEFLQKHYLEKAKKYFKLSSDNQFYNAYIDLAVFLLQAYSNKLTRCLNDKEKIAYKKDNHALIAEADEALSYALKYQPNNSVAAYNLALLHYEKDYGPPNIDTAIKYFKKAANLGHINSCYFLGKILLKSDLPDEGIEYYEKAAEKGNANALIDLATFYECGDDEHPQDPEKAWDYLNRAAKLKDKVALFKLGQWYLEGKFGHFDESKARDCFRLSAELGYPNAKVELKNLKK